MPATAQPTSDGGTSNFAPEFAPITTDAARRHPADVRLADRLWPSMADYIPALPTRQIIPSLTRAQQALVSETVEIKIKISVDESGNVRKAESLTMGNPVLNSAAQSAATQWKFQPARRAEKDIPSEMVLRFEFHPMR